MKTLHAAIHPALFTKLIDLCGLTEHNDIDGTGLPEHANLKKELAAWLPKTQRATGNRQENEVIAAWDTQLCTPHPGSPQEFVFYNHYFNIPPPPR
jgi:hypothetical protein